jgi:hypothetical protein
LKVTWGLPIIPPCTSTGLCFHLDINTTNLNFSGSAQASTKEQTPNEQKQHIMVRQHGSLTSDAETNQAAWEAAKGAAWGGTKWGAAFAVGGGVAYAMSPLYRGFTKQFKVYVF